MNAQYFPLSYAGNTVKFWDKINLGPNICSSMYLYDIGVSYLHFFAFQYIYTIKTYIT